MDGNRFRRFGFLICAITFIHIFAERSFAQSSGDDDIHISAIAEFYALHNYPDLKGHKAFAVGPGGYWMYASGKASVDATTKAAVRDCTATLRTSSYKSLARRKCILFDIDGKRTGKATPTGIPFGTAAQGPDRPYEAGKRWEPTGAPRRGILLLLHGCNKLSDFNGWHWSWINFYRASGFRVIMPDSFTEPRDREVCGHPGEDGIDAQTRNLKLRIAQTLRTIATLRRKYPDEPIYVHGHSEGGYVAQALGEKLAGIIVTGAPCGFGAAAAYWVGKGTPLLVIAGTKDPYTHRARNAGELSAYCKTIRGSGKLTTAWVRGMGHYAAIWWPGVRDPLSRFLGVTPVTVSRKKPEGLAFPDMAPDALAQYRNGATPKAIAANGKNAWSWYWGAESKLDAEEMALFACDENAGFNLFLDRSHQHACALVDVNGKKLVK